MSDTEGFRDNAIKSEPRGWTVGSYEMVQPPFSAVDVNGDVVAVVTDSDGRILHRVEGIAELVRNVRQLTEAVRSLEATLRERAP